MDPKANNWLLPLKGEPVDESKQYVRELGFDALAKWQPTVTFNTLNTTFWHKYFSRKKLADLKYLAALYNLDIGAMKATKGAYVTVLTSFWNQRMRQLR